MSRVEKFLKAYEAINPVSRQQNRVPASSLSMQVDEDDINFIHQVRILYRKQGHPDESMPACHRILAVKYLLLVADNGLHAYEKKWSGNKLEICEFGQPIGEVNDNAVKLYKRATGETPANKEEIADWWMKENKNAFHERKKEEGDLPSPVVKITSVSGNKASLAFRRVSKGSGAKYGWYEVKGIHINMEKFLAKVKAEGFNKDIHGEGLLTYTKWEDLLESEKTSRDNKKKNPDLYPTRPGWQGLHRPKRKAGHSGWIKPGPKTFDYEGLSGCSDDELKNLMYYKDVVCQTVQKDTSSEKELLRHIQSVYQGEVLENYGGIDIFIPALNVGFDYHETLWHLETVIGRTHHWEKANKAANSSMRLIQVYEDEWTNKRDIVKSRAGCILGKSNRIFARKTKVVNLSQDESTKFLERTHIQGNYNCTVAYGLEHDGKVVACMTFGISRFNKRFNCELLRYSSELDTVVVGGADKLLQHFFKERGGVNLISYADRRWSNGNLYKQLHFKLEEITQPSYSYYNVCKGRLLNRIKITKNKLTGMFGYEDHLNVYNIMLLNGFDRIWDAGQFRFVIGS